MNGGSFETGDQHAVEQAHAGPPVSDADQDADRDRQPHVGDHDRRS